MKEEKQVYILEDLFTMQFYGIYEENCKDYKDAICKVEKIVNKPMHKIDWYEILPESEAKEYVQIWVD